MSGETRTIGRRLRVEWLALVGVAVVLAGIGSQFVSTVDGVEAGQRWLLVSGAVLVYQLGFLRYHLARTPDGEGFPDGTIGVANTVTLLRGMLFAGAAGFLLLPPAPGTRWAPGICYGAGAALDYVDGWLARRTGRTTALGARLDHAFDTLGFLVAPLVGVAWGRLPVWYLTLSAARYVFRGGLAWRRRAGRPVNPLPRSRLRRRLAAFQMAFIALALLPVVPTSVLHQAAAVALAPSLAIFVRDWLAVSGRLPRREE